MTNKLAKQLKDAGFSNITHRCSDQHCPLEAGLHYPTLSELMEACVGYGFNHLSWVREEGELDDKGEIMMWEVQDLNGDSYWGHTPEEAVAKLWLQLNKKA